MNGSSLTLRVVSATTLSPSLRHLQLASADGAPLPPTGAGAHVLFNLPGAGRAHRNAYSLVNAPGSRSRYDIIVRRVAASRGGSAAVHERLKVGDELQAQWPANLFAPVRGARRHVMVAGGIGITPFLSDLQDAGVRQ
ncbi:MAG: FAD-binding oxidoreductase, partial [Hydrogenophaga sp.]|nr:FAD-binding oxidoreductase [Hydrogenophaga sp.]